MTEPDKPPLNCPHCGDLLLGQTRNDQAIGDWMWACTSQGGRFPNRSKLCLARENATLSHQRDDLAAKLAELRAIAERMDTLIRWYFAEWLARHPGSPWPDQVQAFDEWKARNPE